jgi:hypothetical protein
MLAHASMPLKFWDETFLTATFIINQLPTPVFNYASPIATLFGDDPAYSFLCTFGCAYGHIFAHIKLTNFLSNPHNVCFLAIALITRAISA